MKLLLKHITLFTAGGLLYLLLEILWRGYSHWTMLLLGGLCFLLIGLINEILPWDMPLWEQAGLGACIVTALEFLTGCVINLWLGWDIWDYSGMPGNLLGQVCPQFFILWVLAALAGIVLDDSLRYCWFQEEQPHYRLGLTKHSGRVAWLKIKKERTNMKNEICVMAGVIGSFIASLFGGFDAALVTLMIFMGIDYVTGLIVAGVFHTSGKTKSGTLESHAGWKGLCKKGVSLLIVLVACRLDLVMGSSFIRDAVVIAFVGNETISIIENAGLMGIPIPEVITRAIEVLENKAERNGEES